MREARPHAIERGDAIEQQAAARGDVPRREVERPRPRGHVAARSNRSSCAGRPGGVLGRLEVRPQPAQAGTRPLPRSPAPRRRAPAPDRPPRPRPVSTSSWTSSGRTPRGLRREAAIGQELVEELASPAVTAIPARGARRRSAGGIGYSTRIGSVDARRRGGRRPRRRSRRRSRPRRPPRAPARPGCAPWPYASAFTTGWTGVPAPASDPEHREVATRARRGRSRPRPSAAAAAGRRPRAASSMGCRPPPGSLRRRASLALANREPEPLARLGPLGDRGEPLAHERHGVRQVGREQPGVAEPLPDDVARRRRGGTRRGAPRARAPGPGRAARRSRPTARRRCRRSRAPGSRTGRRSRCRPARR